MVTTPHFLVRCADYNGHKGVLFVMLETDPRLDTPNYRIVHSGQFNKRQGLFTASDGTTFKVYPDHSVKQWDGFNQRRSVLAREFARLLVRDLGTRTMKRVNRMNKADGEAGRAGICRSHDFCDSNMVMLEAFTTIMGRKPDIGGDTPASQQDIELWSAAWDHAKLNGYWLGGAA